LAENIKIKGEWLAFLMEIAIVNANIPWRIDADALLFSFEKGIIEAGSSNRILSRKPAKMVDAEGRIVIPGLVDAHMHLYSTALSLGRLDLREVESIEELKEKVKEAASKVPTGAWIIGRGWDQEKFREKRYPTRFDLDEASPKNPVVLVRICGHVAVLNTMAMEKLGYLSHTNELPSNLFQKEDGKPTGLIFEEAVESTMSRLPPPPSGLVKEWIKDVLKEYFSLGVTGLYSMSVELEELKLIKEVLWQPDTPPIDYFAYVDSSLMEADLGSFRDIVKGVKIFADGSFGGRTAALREDYNDSPSKGILRLNSEEIYRVAVKAYEKGWQTAIHAIGDRAVLEVLKTVERLPKGAVRIEHGSLVPPDLLDYVSKLKPEIAIQPHFILSDTWIEERLGERTKWVYPFKTLIERGATLLGSSDSPVEPINPWLGIYAAVNRGCPEKLAICKHTIHEKLSFEQALELYYRPAKKHPSLVILNITRPPETKKEFAEIKATKIISRGRIHEPAP
jgi:predicted amidohydrolase YtcJ